MSWNDTASYQRWHSIAHADGDCNTSRGAADFKKRARLDLGMRQQTKHALREASQGHLDHPGDL